RGTPVVHVEGLDARVVRGWVRQDLAAALAPGMPTRVVVNGAAGPKRLEGQIANITAGIDPDLSSEFGMLVTVAFPTMTAAETRVELPHLMPVAVDARRNWIRRFDDWRQRLVHSVFG
ncbi:MAG: HlyD family efflux transporter periplasmic adaptor subunit, partial [Pseudomonadota bacterium]